MGAMALRIAQDEHADEVLSTDAFAVAMTAETARLKESLFRLKFKLALGEVDAVKRIRQEKRSLARLHTITRQRELQSK